MIITKVALFALLILAFSQVQAGPVSVKGKENLYKYSIKVGKNVDSTFKQGLLLNMGVSVRKKADDTYTIKITDVEVRCHRNLPIRKETYADLEKHLKVPFDFNPKDEHGLTIYAPDHTESEASNIKRGLINILEFYDADTKKVEKLASMDGPSGKCHQVMNKEEQGDVEESRRFVRVDSNCTAAKPHQYVKKNFIAHAGTFCEVDPKISRNIGYRVTKSKDGSDKPKIIVRSTETIRLQSLFSVGLFDEINAHTSLELVEVKDASPEEAPTGETTKSCLEVRMKSNKPHDHSAEQPDLLKKSQDGFKMLSHCLKKLDDEEHLEQQSVAESMAFLTMSMKHLTLDSLITLYKSLDSTQQQYFFEILAQDPSEDAFKAVQKIYIDVWGNPDDNPYLVSEAVPAFFENIDHKGKGVTVETVKMFPAFLDKVEELDKTNTRLKSAVVLAGSGIIYENCLRRGKMDEKCSSPEQLMQTLAAKDPENKDEDWQILKLKAIGNMRLPTGIPFIKQILETPTNSLFLRTQAAWTLSKLSRRAPAAKEIALKLFYDRKEDHEIRIAAYLALIMSSPAETESAIQYLIDNNDNEDRQLISYVISSVKSLQSMKYPDGSKCRSVDEMAKALESTVANVAHRLGPKDLFDSAVYSFGTPDRRERILIAIVAAKNDVIPRAVFIRIQDPLQERSYSLHSISDAVLYNNMIHLREAVEKMKKQNKIVNPDIKNKLDAIFSKVKGKPTSDYFAMSVVETVDGTAISYEKFNKPDEVIQRVMSSLVENDKYHRTFKKYNDIAVKSHTESGLKIKFMTGQSAVTSLEMPVMTMGTAGRTGIPIHLKYSYKFISKSAYLTMVELPESKFKYVTGKISDKSMALPRNVTVNFMKKSGDAKLTHVIAKVRDEPLFAKTEMDMFYRALTPVDGNVESMEDFKKIVKEDKKELDSHTHMHEYFGIGMKISNSIDYKRPMIWETPLTRMSPIYQEIEHETKPYKYKVQMTKSDGDKTTPKAINYEVNFITGMKGDDYITLIGTTFNADGQPKSVRFTGGVAISTKNLEKRMGLFSYENNVKKIYIRSHMTATLPTDNVPIPSFTENTPEAKEAYGKQKIQIKAQFKFTPTNRAEFVEDDMNELIKGIGDDVDATGEAEFFRTEEQIQAYASSGNAVDQDVSENLYSMMIAKAQAHPGCYLRTWDDLLKFHGMKGSVKHLKPIPDRIKDIRRRIKDLLVKRFWSDMTFDIEDKAEQGNLFIMGNSSIDSSRTDLTIKGYMGTTKYTGIKSYLIPYMRPSASPIKVFKSNTFNPPVCSMVNQSGHSEIETFSRRDIMTDDMQNCEYLLTSNCRGIKNFAITYSKKDDSYKILYDNKHEIVIFKDHLTFNGVKNAEADGAAMADDGIAFARYKGLLAVMLPNRISFIREVNKPNAYIRASKLFRGRLCGLCGSNDGDYTSDDISSLADYAVGDSCPA